MLSSERSQETREKGVSFTYCSWDAAAWYCGKGLLERGEAWSQCILTGRRENVVFSLISLFNSCRICPQPAKTTWPPVLLTAVYSASFSLHLSPSSSLSPNPGPLTLIYSQPPSTHGRPCHLTRHAASANQGGRGMSPPNMDLFTPPASWCTCAALTMVVAYFQVYEEVRCKS